MTIVCACGTFACGLCSDCESGVCSRHSDYLNDQLVCPPCFRAQVARNEQINRMTFTCFLSLMEARGNPGRKRLGLLSSKLLYWPVELKVPNSQGQLMLWRGRLHADGSGAHVETGHLQDCFAVETLWTAQAVLELSERHGFKPQLMSEVRRWAAL